MGWNLSLAIFFDKNVFRDALKPIGVSFVSPDSPSFLPKEEI
jgi:hypothetical protein